MHNARTLELVRLNGRQLFYCYQLHKMSAVKKVCPKTADDYSLWPGLKQAESGLAMVLKTDLKDLLMSLFFFDMVATWLKSNVRVCNLFPEHLFYCHDGGFEGVSGKMNGQILQNLVNQP